MCAILWAGQLWPELIEVDTGHEEHSCTRLLGVLADIKANPLIVDAIFSLSVEYRALECIGALRHLGLCIDMRAAVALFG